MEEIDLKDILNMVWRKRIYILCIVVLFCIIGIIYSFKFVIPEYKSKTTIVLTKTEEDNRVIAIIDGDDTISQTDLDINSKIIKTYSGIVKTESVLEKAIANLKLNKEVEDVKKNVTVEIMDDTDIIEISYKDTNSETAKNLTNEIAKEFISKIKEIYNIDNLFVVDEAKTVINPCNINHIKDIAIFTFIGVIVAIGFVLIANMLEDTVKKVDDIEKDLELNSLIEIPLIENIGKKSKGKKELIVGEKTRNQYSEIIRKLRTRMQYIMKDKNTKTLLITSTIPGAGKSFITTNLAASFAQIGCKVALIDADMRKGRQHKMVGGLKTPGLSNYLAGVNEYGKEDLEKPVLEYFQKTDINNLDLLSSGTTYNNASELLSSERFNKLISEVESAYDILIFDGTPSSIVTDSVIISKIVGATVLVEEVNVAKKDEIKKIKKDIEEVDGKIVGVVLNKTKGSKRNYRYGYKYYIDDNLPNVVKYKKRG